MKSPPILPPSEPSAQHYNSIWMQEEKLSESSAPIRRTYVKVGDEFQKCISHWYAHNRRDRNAIERGWNTCRDLDSRPLRIHMRACSDRLRLIDRLTDRQWVAVIPASRVPIGQFVARFARYRVTKSWRGIGRRHLGWPLRQGEREENRSSRPRP